MVLGRNDVLLVVVEEEEGAAAAIGAFAHRDAIEGRN